MTISRVRSKYLNGHLWKLFWSITKQKFYAIFLEKKNGTVIDEQEV